MQVKWIRRSLDLLPRAVLELRGVADLRSSVRSTALRASDPQVKLTRDAGPETTHSVVLRRPRLRPARSRVGPASSTSQAVHAKLSRRQRASALDQTRALDLLPREAPPHVVELRGGADLARAARASDPQARLLIFVQPDLRI